MDGCIFYVLYLYLWVDGCFVDRCILMNINCSTYVIWFGVYITACTHEASPTDQKKDSNTPETNTKTRQPD